MPILVKNMKKIILLFGVFTLLFTTGIADSFAVKDGWLEDTRGENGLGIPDQDELPEELRPGDLTVREQIIRVVNYFLTFLGLIAVIAIIYFGFLMLTSAGNDEQVSKAKTGIIWVVLGILVILFAYVFVVFLINAFKGNA